jgi:peptide/nickel transport system substrate-binding protein
MRINKASQLLLFALLFCLNFSCTHKRDLTKNILLVHFLAEPKSLHLTNDNSAYQRTIFHLTQKRLININITNNKLAPDLLESMPELQNDSLQYVCKLRQGIKWDNGQPLTVADVLFTLKMIICPMVNNPDQKSYFKNLLDVKVDGSDSLVFRIINSKRYFDNASMLSYAVIMQENRWDPNHILRKYSIADFQNATFNPENEKALSELVAQFNASDNGRIPQKFDGLGPYYVSDWQTGSSITLTKKKKWWGEKSNKPEEAAFPEKIIFTIIKDMEPTVLALKKQDIDVSCELSGVALNKLQKRDYFNENYESAFVGSFSYTYVGLNTKPNTSQNPYFTDKRVRRAIAHLVPVEEIIQVIAKGKARRIASFVLPEQAEFNKNLPLIEYNLNKAKSLLDEAGWKDTDGDNVRDKLIGGKRIKFNFQLSYMISPVTKEIVQIIRNEMYKAGIEVGANPLDFSIFYQTVQKHEFDAMLGSWSTSSTPEDPRQLWHTESWKTYGSNFVGFGNEYSDSLIEKANVEMNPAKRELIMGEIQKLVWEEQPYVFLFNATKKIAISKRFENRGMYPERPHILYNYLKLNSVGGLTTEIIR